MSLTHAEVSQAVMEVAPVVLGGRIQKIHQPAEGTIVFDIRVPGHTHRVLLSCQPESARIHFLTAPLPNPPRPFPFCQYLRAHLQGARIEALRQVAGDRIVEWRLATKRGPRALIHELTGRHADLLVLADRIVVRHLNKDADILGKPYEPPERPAPTSHNTEPSRFPRSRVDERFPASAAIERHYQQAERSLAQDSARLARVRTLRQIVKKGQRRIDGWRDDLARAAKYRAYSRYGDLLKANLGSITKGMDSVSLIDYFDDSLPLVTIPLDPAKNPRSNMEEYFRKHRKHARAELELQPRIEQAERDLAEARRELMNIEQGTWIPPTVTTPRESQARNRRKSAPERRPFKRFTSMDGLQIFVGRNARENEALTFGLARSDDLWLHARGVPGAHVLVRIGKGKDLPQRTLHEAAMLALLYSDLRRSGKGDILYTRRKWVKKAKGQAPGTVLAAREQSIFVSLDPGELARLKARNTEDA